jgi:hypothetical protein
MADHAAPEIAVDDIWFKSKRVLRTLVQTGIPSFLVFAGVLPQIIAALGLPVDSAVYLWLLAAAGIVTAVATGLARVMAIPAVNVWLTHIGLGSVPKGAAVKQAEAQAVTAHSPDQITDGSDFAPAGTSPVPSTRDH